MERTEEDKVLQSPIEVKLGGRTYKIKPLVIRDAREWRKKAADLFGCIPQRMAVTTDQPQEFEAIMQALLVSTPDAVADLFFGYAKDLPREEIEARATEAELGAAMAEVFKIAFPLLRSLTAGMAAAVR